jgi:hypothetical protein
MPRKAAWLEFQTNPELEFEFFLAQKLGKTVAELQTMSGDEFMRWAIFYGRKRQREELALQKAG